MLTSPSDKCYFLLSASPELPILYYVDRLREGRSYTTRFVRAAQNGKIVFMMMCSFHRPEPAHPFHQWPMPLDVPQPEDMEQDIDHYRATLALGPDKLDDKMRAITEEALKVKINYLGPCNQ